MITVEVTDISKFDQSEIDRCFEDLSDSRRARITNEGTKDPRAERIIVSYLLESAVRVFGYAGEITYRYDGNGKPFFAWEGAPFFSLSHSGSYVAFAVSDSPIGIDVEDLSVHRKTDHRKIAQRFFTANETEWIGDDRERFFRVWTFKEAYAKATGQSAAQNLSVWDYTAPRPDGMKLVTERKENAIYSYIVNIK